MSTDIKPGQIWQWNSALPDEPALVVTKTEGDNVHYRYEGESIAGEHHRDTEHFTERAHLVEDATPAPLDPSKVAITLKGGDYIEAESDGTKIGGKVSHVTERGFVAIEHLGEFAIHHITPSPLPKGYRMFTLTAHTPAPEPEPEPEWNPGTVWADQEGERYWFTDDGREDGRTFRNDADGEYLPDEMGGLRPLVVIDPAAVDMGALTRALHNASHYGVDLPLEGAAYLARVARTFFVGGESR